jgi:hypothetical protein
VRIKKIWRRDVKWLALEFSLLWQTALKCAECHEENNLSADCQEENNRNADRHEANNRTADCQSQD